jgi:hypothetical protein
VVQDSLDGEDLDLEDDQPWLGVPNLGSPEGLLDAIDGRGAFSRFRRVLDEHPETLPGWYAVRAERRAGRARAWLADGRRSSWG